jgi:hypothetical protein
LPVAALEDAGDGWGEGCSVGDMVNARRVGWEEYRHGGRVKKGSRDCARRCLMLSGLDQLMSAIDHPISLANSAKMEMKSIDSYPNMSYTVKL